MRALPWTLWALLLGAAPGLAAPDEWVTLTNASGTAIQVRLEGKTGERYVLRRKSDQKVFEVPADKLKPAERTMLDAAAKAGEAEMGKLNAALKLRPESSTKFSKSERERTRASSCSSAIALRCLPVRSRESTRWPWISKRFRDGPTKKFARCS
jgi:hypothetical protein